MYVRACACLCVRRQNVYEQVVFDFNASSSVRQES